VVKGNKNYDSLLFLQLIWKKGRCYASFVISQNHIPIQQQKSDSLSTNKVTHNTIRNINHKIHYNNLYNPVFVNKKIWGLQITMHYHWSTAVQIVHSSGLNNQKRTRLYIMRSLVVTAIIYLVKLHSLKDNKILQHQGPSATASAHLIDC